MRTSPPERRSAGSNALVELRRTYPALRGMSDDKVSQVVARALRAHGPHTPEAVRFAGRLAAERNCVQLGPVEIAPGTWAHRSADGRTHLWHRQPTAAERRAVAPRAAARSASPRTARTPVRPKSPATRRVERLFR